MENSKTNNRTLKLIMMRLCTYPDLKCCAINENYEPQLNTRRKTVIGLSCTLYKTENSDAEVDGFHEIKIL